MAQRTFTAKFESMCPHCYLTIREGMDVEYVQNEVVHTKCAEKMRSQFDAAINKAREESGYL